MRKLGIIANCIAGEAEKETLKRIKDRGFECFFSSEKEFGEKYVGELKNESEKLGLDYEFIHGPFVGINEMWTSEEEPEIHRSFIKAIDSAGANGIKTLIAHVSSSFRPPDISDKGVARFDAWVERAEKRGVVIAFENLRKLGNLAYLMDRYEGNPFVKFCYDCGHEHCYTVSVPFIPIYGDRLICTHLHDNFGQDKSAPDGGDKHLLPFDGNVDYAAMMKSLDKVGYKGSLMLEVFSGYYPTMTPDDFLTTAYERVKKISRLG